MNTAGPVWKASELGCVEAKGALCFLSSTSVETCVISVIESTVIIDDKITYTTPVRLEIAYQP